MLLVEDDEDDYIITRDLLDDIAGGAYRLDWAADLQSARELLSLNEHDVCLMDYALGPSDGVSLLKEAQTLGFNRPIIMLTGQDDEHLDEQALSAGAVDYLVKSNLTESRLARAIRYAIARRETEVERMERLRAESENRAKSEFLAHLSHELRTPLSSILGYTDLLIRQSSDDTVDYLGVIKRNGHHLLSLLNDVLDLSKIEAGKLELETHPLDFPRFLSDVYHLLRVRADDKNIRLQFLAPQRLPSVIHTDPTRLRQVLLNILGNAIKFTHQGQVSFQVTLEEALDDWILNLQITDTGMGIAPEFLPKLFKPFSQAPAVQRTQSEGTGLGLAISRQLAQRLGGDITVQSELGKGSCFTVKIAVGLPEDVAWVALELDRLGASTLPPELPRLQARILVADDVPDLRVLLGQILAGMGVRTEVAVDGHEALEKVMAAQQQQPFDLVLMDIQMPVMDGLEATAQLRKQGYSGPIVALTAATMEGERERCLAAGCTDYLSKPVDEGRLVQCILHLLESSPSPSHDPAPAPAPAPAENQRRLLLVEDDEDAARMTALLIESLGWQVQIAASGADAQQAYAALKPDLILMDMGLPDCSGEELAAQLQRLDDKPPPMVALSGHEFSSAQRARSIFSDHLLKPVNMELIRSALEKAVDKNVNKGRSSSGAVNGA